jgi:hypothetical protein
MSKLTESSSETDGSDADFDSDVDPALARTPIRFGRLALWAASASALSIGVVGTVAYGVWFNQDQHAYAEAMEHARQTLWLAVPAPTPALAPDPTPAVQQMAASGDAATPLSFSRPVSVANADMSEPVASAQVDSRATPSGSAAPTLAVTRPVRVGCAPSVQRRHPVSRAKPNNNVLTRMGSFFHRVSYRQHDTESQRDIYAHP